MPYFSVNLNIILSSLSECSLRKPMCFLRFLTPSLAKRVNKVDANLISRRPIVGNNTLGSHLFNLSLQCETLIQYKLKYIVNSNTFKDNSQSLALLDCLSILISSKEFLILIIKFLFQSSKQSLNFNIFIKHLNSNRYS